MSPAPYGGGRARRRDNAGVTMFSEARGRLSVSIAACALLLAQFLLGMAVNLEVVIPKHHPGAQAVNYFGGVVSALGWVIPSGAGWVAAHATFGLALVLAALVAVVLTWRRGSRAERLMTVLGLVLIIGAGFNGASFLNYGNAINSFIMATLWALATACYVTSAVIAARRA